MKAVYETNSNDVSDLMVLKTILESSGIPCFIREQISPERGGYSAIGRFLLEIPEEKSAEADSIVKEFLREEKVYGEKDIGYPGDVKFPENRAVVYSNNNRESVTECLEILKKADIPSYIYDGRRFPEPEETIPEGKELYLLVESEKEGEAIKNITAYMEALSYGRAAEMSESQDTAEVTEVVEISVPAVKQPLRCPECGSEEFAPTLLSIIFGGDKYKCAACGNKFRLKN